jgi:dihydrofolate reductase
MRKLVMNAQLTLDGVAQGPGGPDEDRENGFTYGGWVAPFFEDELDRFVTEATRKATALVLGRRTYDIWEAYWPKAAADGPIGAQFNRIPKYVASRTRRPLAWSNSIQLEGDAAEAVAALKKGTGGEIQMWGSLDLAQTLIEHDLIDEYRLIFVPALIGSGKKLFAEGTVPQGLRLIDSRTTPKGVVIASYARAGELKQGTMVEEPAH